MINEKTGTKICTGGSIKTISKIKDIKYFELCFTRVLEHYASTLAPYRKIQEKISQEVKRLGFEGKIHGCIIDVDFYHHIMLNLQDGTVTFYYSPYWGCVRQYPSFEVMLQDIEGTLREAASQLNASKSEAETARKFYGNKLSDIALKMFPNETVQSKYLRDYINKLSSDQIDC